MHKRCRAGFVAHGEGTPDRRQFSATTITNRLGSSTRHQHAQCTLARGISELPLVAVLLPPGPSRAISPSVAIPTGNTAPRTISNTTRARSTASQRSAFRCAGSRLPSHGRSRHDDASHPLSGGAEDDLTSSLHREQISLGRFAEQSTA